MHGATIKIVHAQQAKRNNYKTTKLKGAILNVLMWNFM